MTKPVKKINIGMLSFKEFISEIAFPNTPKTGDISSHATRVKNLISGIMESPYVHTDHVTGRKYEFSKLSHALTSYAGAVQSKFHSQIDTHHTDEEADGISQNVETHYKPFLTSVHNHYVNMIGDNLRKDPQLMDSLKEYANHTGVDGPSAVISGAFSHMMTGTHNYVSEHLDNVHNNNYTSSSDVKKSHTELHRIAEAMHTSPMGAIYMGGMHPRFGPREVK